MGSVGVFSMESFPGFSKKARCFLFPLDLGALPVSSKLGALLLNSECVRQHSAGELPFAARLTESGHGSLFGVRRLGLITEPQKRLEHLLAFVADGAARWIWI